MVDGPAESLNAKFAALHEERVRTWDPAQLAKNVDQRRELVERFDPAKAIQPGARIDPFTLIDVDGVTLTLEQLTAEGPAVLIFFRFAGCPADNIALPYYDRALRPALDEAGIPLVAVSPQVPDKLRDIRDRHGLGFRVASDRDNRLARTLGIAFVPGQIPADPPAGWIGEITGTGTWELPQPSMIVIDRDHIVRYADISPDWMRRAEASEILAVIEQAERRAAA